MPTFLYRARDKDGKTVRGLMEAAGQELLVDRLRSLGYLIISISEEKKTTLPFEDTFARMRKIKSEELVMFIQQLAAMIGAGMSLPNGLEVLIEQVENKKLKDVTMTVYQDIKGGQTFSEALEKHPEVFSSVFVSMVHAGEATGNLEEILNRLAGFAEREADIRQKIGGALTYPMILMVLGSVVITYVTAVVLPSFVNIFKQASVPLPGPTLFLYTIGMGIRGVWLYALIGIIGLWIGLKRLTRAGEGKYYADLVKLRLPVWGELIRRVTIARFARTLATLLNSGVPVLRSLEIVQRTMDNEVVARVIDNVRAAVSRGESISEPLKASGQFPPMTTQMIAIGEETGALDTMLIKIADFYDTVVEYTIKKVSALLEPIFLVVIGGMVGLIFAAILLPIFGMMKTLKKRA